MNAAKKISDYTTINLVLDAHFDLHEAGKDTSDASVADFADAYQQCAACIAEKSGVAIEVTETSCMGPEAHSIRKPKDGEFGASLWQDIHDCLSESDGEWTYSEVKAQKVAASLADDAVDAIAEILSPQAKSAVEEMVAEELDGEADVLVAAVREKLVGSF